MEKIKWVVDESRDADGFFTIRIADGTKNGDTDSQPIATVYNKQAAKAIVNEHNRK
jgi:hypothetical protein